MKIPPEHRLPVVHDRINRADARSGVSLLLAVAPLAVTAHPRYQPTKDGRAFANVFIWDATRALVNDGDEVPLWRIEHVLENGEAKEQPSEFTALGMIGWLRSDGKARGWRTCAEGEARRRADAGCPTVATWMNPKFIDGKPQPSHLAILLPSPINGPQLIAQAGVECLFGAPIKRGFCDASPLEYYTHD